MTKACPQPSHRKPVMNRLARVALFSAASILSNVPALAADLPARAPVAPVAYVPAFSWTGFYLGGALGWIETSPEYTTGAVVLGTPFIVSSASNRNGLSYGILSGYNYQMGQVVLGVEGDFTGWTVGKIRYTSITGDFLTAHSKWGGSIRGRFGYAADRALFYLTGGAAFVSNETSIPTTGISIGGDGVRWGWTVGGGIDYAFTNNWFTGIEYRYSQYETRNFVYPIPILNLGVVGFKQELSTNQVTARIGYKF
ncbi:MAG: porin family protein [Bradyrhizobium sp.]|nr:porin family protein [Bradyrhizobium sp.]